MGNSGPWEADRTQEVLSFNRDIFRSLSLALVSLRVWVWGDLQAKEGARITGFN